MLLDAKAGALWVRTSAPTGQPDAADRLSYVSEFSFDVSKETQERGPYVGDAAFTTSSNVTYEGSFSIEVPRAASPVINLLMTAAKSTSQKLWMQFREGEVDGSNLSAVHVFTGVTITSLSVSNDGETVTYEVEFTADGHTYTASTLT